MRDRGQVHAELPGDGRVRVGGINLSADERGQLERAQPGTLLVLGELGSVVGSPVGSHLPTCRSIGSDSPTAWPLPSQTGGQGLARGLILDSLSTGAVRNKPNLTCR